MARRQLFPQGVNLEIPRYQSEEMCTIESVETLQQITEADYQKITKICNEHLIYETLFRERYKGKSYSMKAAEEFIKMAVKGWADGSWLVFFIRNAQKEIVAAIDLKAIENDQAEIGYWASENFPGIMTNAVEIICQLAKKNGLAYLYALVRPENEKSANVVLRLHFTETAKRRVNGKIFHIFAKNL